MGKVNNKTCSTICFALDYFCGISGQTTNCKKPGIIFSKNCNATTASDISSYLGIKCHNSFGRYLGFLIINSNPNYKDYQPIIDKMRAKFLGWKINYLNLAGRATLISSTLSDQLAYYMQYTLLPLKPLKTINQIQRNFLWGSNDTEKITFY